jgi:hypothetical protein
MKHHPFALADGTVVTQRRYVAQDELLMAALHRGFTNASALSKRSVMRVGLWPSEILSFVTALRLRTFPAGLYTAPGRLFVH